MTTWKGDCFAFHNLGRDGCGVLKIRNCEGCKFYKTKAEAKESTQKARERLQTLDYASRRGITEKYGTKIF